MRMAASELSSFESAQREHARFNSGWLRASIFGLSDGIVSILSLELGVFASTDSSSGERRLRSVALAGISGILAGASSMAVGEYISVQTNAEALRAQIEVERRHLRVYAEGEGGLFTERLNSRFGVDRAVAQALLHNLARREGEAADESARLDRQTDLHVRVLSGLDPVEQGSALMAAWSSFLSFLVGGAVPTAPWLVAAYNGGLSASAALGISIGLAAFLLAAVGAIIKLAFTFTARESGPGDGWWVRMRSSRAAAATWSATRQVGMGAAATSLTYVIGLAVGGSPS